MQAQMEVAALERIAAEAVEIQPCRAGDEGALFRSARVVQPLQVNAPAAELVDLVEEPEVARGQRVPEDRLAVRGDVLVQLAAGSGGSERAREVLPTWRGPPRKTILRARSAATAARR
jgi:hypothetical protein